jgi:hypothetical protein
MQCMTAGRKTGGFVFAHTLEQADIVDLVRY